MDDCVYGIMSEKNYGDGSHESCDDCILYELLVYSEWKQDPELLKCSRAGDAQFFSGYSHQSSTKHIWQFFGSRESLCDEIQRLLLRQLPWHFAVGEGGKVVAILQDTILEIRTSRDEYSSVVGKASIAKDANPQLRKLAWSPDCSMLAVGHSNGVVSFYDLLGSNIFNIYPPKFQEDNQVVDKKNALVFISFLQSRRKNPKWSAEIILANYQGNLHCYLVSPTDGYQQSHTFSFTHHYRQGVLAISYHPSHNMLFVSGPTALKNTDSLEDHGSSIGLSAWRLLNDHPYYRLALSTDEEQAIWLAKNSWWNWVPSVRSKPEKSVIFKMQVSPSGKLLACLHSCGSISLWQLPAIRLFKYWNLQEQPDYDVQNPQHSKLSDRRNYQGHNKDIIFRPVDINWWTDNAVIIARYSGAISVCSVMNLRNLLGESPEFLAGPPQVSALCSDHGFLGLECETILTSKKWPWGDHVALTEVESSDDNEDDDEDDEDDDDGSEDASLLNRSTALIQSAVYMVTDMERFQPKRKKPKVCHRTYRLLGLKSTTPEELYARKIDNEEYGEALALAKAYGLDCDLVYQQQWRNNKVSIVTIHDYLSKVTKRSWVLKECVERVPETFAAARELLQFGLQGTNVDTFVAVGEGTDGGHFVQQCQDSDDDVDDNWIHGPDVVRKRLQKRNEVLLSKAVLDKLTKEQQQLLHYRQQLLQYFDRLCTYELIMGGPHMADELYDYSFYDKFRTVPLIVSTVKFAREGNWQAVEILFTYHGEAILLHWLPILSNFPETMNPYEYKSLLPESSADGNVFPWNQIELREEDWCEGIHFQSEFVDCNDDEAGFIYEEDQSLKNFICSKEIITSEILTSWYRNRVHQVENRSCMVDHALTLIELARERNIMGLDHLYNQLLTLDTLVYEVHIEDARLSDLQKTSELETCKLLMSKSGEATFIDDLKHLVLPFVLRCEKQTAGSRKKLLLDYLMDLSSQDLSLPLKMFEHLRDEQSCSLVPSMEERISLALNCLYAYPNADQLSKAFRILECIPGRGFGSQNAAVAVLHDKLDDLECDLHAAEILDRNSIHKSLSFIRDCKSNVTMILQLMVKLARTVARKIPSPSEADWNQLLTDMLELQTNFFSKVNIEDCFEIYVATILASGSKKNIEAAGDILASQETDWSDKKVSYNSGVKLVLQAALEYFDSASSASDPAMDLARACLNLITDENEETKEQMDLISALQLLSDFGIHLLPLQVRLCTDRLRLVESCIHNKPAAYRNTQRLLQLAHKLRICGTDERQREGQVLVLIAEAALEAQDYQFSAEICQQLVLKSHIIGWQVVEKLGQCQEFENLQLRCDLLAFALLYCPIEMVEVLINTRCLLQVQLLHEMINHQVKQEVETVWPIEEEEFSDALTSPLSPSREFPSPMHIVEDLTKTTKNVTFGLLKNIGNKHFWKATFSWMQRNMSDAVTTENNFPLLLQGVPAFYSSLQTDYHISCFSTKYDRFSEPDISDPVVKLCQALLRTILLQGTASEGNFNNGTNVLLQLAEQFLPEDSCLGLGYILPFQDVTLIDSCLNNLPCTSISLQLAIYYYAIQGYKLLQTPSEDRSHQQNVYFYTPHELVEYVTKLASKHKASATWAELLLKYRSLLIDFQQGQQLQSLGCGVDLQRFTHDTEYQRDSILGLAMTIDADKFFLAVKLGSRHGVPIGDIVARHLTSLLLSSEGIQLSELTTRLANPQLVELLKISPQHTCSRLVQHAYSSIGGTDHQLLLSYFTVLQSIAEDYTTYNLIPKEHIKLLRKVKATSSDIDYKKIVDPSNSLLEVLLPALERNNIGLIAKLLKSMPMSIKCTIQTGELYAAWAQKEFFKIPNTTDLTSTEDWLEQYELCTAHFNKMAATDILNFVKGTCFTEHGVDMMSSECRTTIVTRVKEYSQLKLIYPLEDEEDEWNEAVKVLDHWLAHLEIVNTLEASEFLKNSEQEGQHLLRLFDLSMGEDHHIAELLQLAVISKIQLDSLKLLIAFLPNSVKTLEQCLSNLLKNATEKIRSGNEPQGSQLLSAVLRRMNENMEYNSNTVSLEVETLCGDPNLTPEIRLQALELLQSLKPNEMRSDIMLLYRHTQATVASVWPKTSITLQESDLKTPESRGQLFCRLLKHAHTWQQIIILKDLLNKWPPFKDSNSSSDTNPWIQLLHKMLIFEDKDMDEIESVLEDIFKQNIFSPVSIQHLVSQTEESTGLPLLLLICLLQNHSSLHTVATNLIHKHLHADDPKLSDRLLSLLLQKGLAPALISTPAYSQMIEHMLVKCSYELPSWNTIANQLVATGNVAEAGSVLLLHMGVSPALAVFSSSLALAKTTSSEE